MSLGSHSGRGCLGGDVKDRSSLRKRPFWSETSSINFHGDSKPKTEDRGHDEWSDGFDFKKTASLGSPPGRKRLGGDGDDLSSTRKWSLRSESSYETFPLESKLITEDGSLDERRDGSYIPHSWL